MGRLVSCRFDVFGARFDAGAFKVLMGGKGEVNFFERPNPRSLIGAYREGNVGVWSSDKSHISKNYDDDDLSLFLKEEIFIIDFIEKYSGIYELAASFCREPFEIWLVLIYEASFSEKPNGVHFSASLINKVSSINASITTEVLFLNDT